MRKVMAMILTTVIFCIFPLSARAADDLSDWEIVKKTGTPEMNVSGTTVTFSANGSSGTEHGFIRKTIPGTIGVLGEITVSTIKGDDASCGFSKILGKLPSGNYVQALVDLTELAGDKTVRYRIRVLDGNNDVVRVMAYGYLGNTKNGWSIGKSVLVGLALLGDDIYFYTPGNGAFTKIQPLQAMGSIDAPTSIFVWAGNGPNSIGATVENVVTF